MKFLTNIPNIIFESNQAQNNPQMIDEIDAIADTIKDNMNKEIKVPKDVLDSFKIKKTLNQDIWVDDKLDPRVRLNLIKVAKDFFKELEIPSSAKIKDIIFTGSLANFNWSKFSDIDLHIVLDFKELDSDPKFTEDYFKAKKTIWNQEHDITVFGYPVELYVQDLNQKLVATAVYSVLNDEWVKKPSREEFKLDTKAILTKANNFINQLRDIRKDYKDKQYQSVVDKVIKLKKKIKDMRTAGLEKGGEFSLENLVFKTLRRTPFLDILDSFKAKSYDKLMSVMEENNMMDEGEVLDKTSFKAKKEDEDETTINAMYEGQRIGSLSMVAMQNAYWYFEDYMSEDEYDKLFPDDNFMQIGYIKIYDKQYMGEGIAKKLMNIAITKAKKEGFTTIYLNASPMGDNGLKLNDLVGFYKKFGFKEIIHQGNNVQMILHINSETLSEETNRNIKGGVLFIKGAELDNGEQRLFVTTINNLLNLDRKKVDDSKGEPAEMALLGNQVYRVTIKNDKLTAVGVDWKSQQILLKSLGLKRNGVVLNDNKTPQHWKSLTYTNINKALSSMNFELLNIPNIRWVG